MKQFTHMWKDNYLFWRDMDIPVHIVRYEDLCDQPGKTIEDLVKFVLNVEDISGTKVEKLVENACGSYKGIYNVRPGGGVANKNLWKYSDEQIEFIKSVAGEEMSHYGYMEQFRKEGDPELPPNTYV